MYLLVQVNISKQLIEHQSGSIMLDTIENNRLSKILRTVWNDNFGVIMEVNRQKIRRCLRGQLTVSLLLIHLFKNIYIAIQFLRAYRNQYETNYARSPSTIDCCCHGWTTVTVTISVAFRGLNDFHYERFLGFFIPENTNEEMFI